MSKKTWIVITSLVVVFGLIQFIRPVRNQQTNPSRYDIFHKTDTEAAIVNSFQSSCYDCHSNVTAYPWYASVAPVSWIISQHVKDGKKHLNFSEWVLYDKDKQIKKLMEIDEMISEAEMPPKYYLLMHKDVKMSESDKAKMLDWVSAKKAEVQLLD